MVQHSERLMPHHLLCPRLEVFICGKCCGSGPSDSGSNKSTDSSCLGNNAIGLDAQTGLTFNNCTLCPQCKTATCATYSINWLVFITEMKSVYSSVRTGSLNKAYRSRDAQPGLTFNNCTLCPQCIYVFCIYLRTNNDLCHLQHKLIGFYNRDEKCLQFGTDWVFK